MLIFETRTTEAQGPHNKYSIQYTVLKGIKISELCITRNVKEIEMQHEIFLMVSRFLRYVKCYISENRLPLGQCSLRSVLCCIRCKPRGIYSILRHVLNIFHQSCLFTKINGFAFSPAPSLLLGDLEMNLLENWLCSQNMLYVLHMFTIVNAMLK